MRTICFLSQGLFLALLLAACAADASVTFAGNLVPQAGTCDPQAPAILIKRGRDIQFTPSQGVLLLYGQIGPSGDITASLTTPGADRKPYRLKLVANLSGAAITGAYTTPRCRYAVRMTRARG